MALPIFNDPNKNLMLLQNNWASQINPVLARVQNKSVILKKQLLINGTNVLNHLLGRELTGWTIIRQRSGASIYDLQDNNQTPALTLVLVSDAIVTVDLEVF